MKPSNTSICFCSRSDGEYVFPFSAAAAVFSVVDCYEGSPLRADEISITVRVTLHPKEQTLTDAETEGYRQELVAELDKRLAIRLRG